MCIIIIVLFSHQPSSYTKYTRLNMRLFYNIKMVFNAKCAFLIRLYILWSLQLPYLICLRVLYDSYYREAGF